jgi:hypothetical protein
VLADWSILLEHRQGPDGFNFHDDEQLRAALVKAYGRDPPGQADRRRARRWRSGRR